MGSNTTINLPLIIEDGYLRFNIKACEEWMDEGLYSWVESVDTADLMRGRHDFTVQVRADWGMEDEGPCLVAVEVSDG